jgi:hypothetical protein
MTSNHHAPYALGYTRTTMAQTEGSNAARRSKSRKCVPISGHVFGKTEKKENRNKISFHPPRHVIYSEYQEKKGGSRD